MEERTSVIPWIAVGVIGITLAAFLTLLYTGVLFSEDSDTDSTVQAQELVQGTKRIPGTYTVASKAVGSELGTPDVTIDVDIMSFAFRPDEIRVKEGQIVKLLLHGKDDGQLPSITGTDAFSGHGLQVNRPYDIWITGLRENTTREVVFEATIPGEFLIECVVLCGVGHTTMQGKLIVEEAQQ